MMPDSDDGEFEVFRVFRLVRFVRLARLFHLISELRTLVSSILASMKSVGYTLALIGKPPRYAIFEFLDFWEKIEYIF